MKKIILNFIFVILISFLLFECSSNSDYKNNEINIEEAIPSDGFQKRRDGLFYKRNTQKLVTGILHDETFIRQRMLEGNEGTYIDRYFSVKKGLINGKLIELHHFTDGYNASRNAWGFTVVEDPVLVEEVFYEDGFVFGSVKEFSYNGDIIVEGHVENGIRIGIWQVFNGETMIPIKFENNKYVLPKGTELESNIQGFLDREWNKGINEFY